MVITYHAQDRMKERCNLKKKSMERMATKALEQGLKHSDVSGILQRWLDKVYLQHKRANNTRLYGDYAWLFHDDILITVMEIPNDFKKILQKQKKAMLKDITL